MAFAGKTEATAFPREAETESEKMSKSNVVGFYKKNGTTRPITLSDTQLLEQKSRRIKKPKRFRAVKPKIAAAGGMARVLDLLEKKAQLQDQIFALESGRDELSYTGGDCKVITQEIKQKYEKLRKVRKALRRARKKGKNQVVRVW